MQQGVCRIGILMMFEDAFDLIADSEGLLGIAQQVSDHSDVSGMRQVYEYSQVRTARLQSGMRGMPHSLPAEDSTYRFNLGPCQLKGVTGMAYPFRTKLPRCATIAALHQKPVLPQSRPIRRG